jgi:hypothetical protein
MCTVVEPRTAMRDLLAEILGDDAVEQLTAAQVGRILGATFMTARRELERNQQIPGQLALGLSRRGCGPAGHRSP